MPTLPTVLPEVPTFITDKHAELAVLCREYGVSKLEVFGSVMTDEFDLERSDIDFIVTFYPFTGLTAWIDRLSGLEQGLARLFGRDADVIDARARGFDNPFFARFAKRTRSVIFDADQREVRSPAA